MQFLWQYYPQGPLNKVPTCPLYCHLFVCAFRQCILMHFRSAFFVIWSRKKISLTLKVFHNFNDFMILCIHTVGSFSCPISEHDPWNIWVNNWREENNGVWRIQLLYDGWSCFVKISSPSLYLPFFHPFIQIKREQRYTDIPNHPVDSEITLMNISHNVYVCRAVLLPVTSPIVFLSI